MSQKRSALWIHFTMTSADKAECNMCKTTYSYKGGSTSNLRKHLRSRHPTVLLEAEVSRSEKVPRLRSPQRNIEEHQMPTAAASTSSANVSEADMSAAIQPQQTSMIKKMQQTTLSSFIRKPVSLPRQKFINDLILNLIVKDLQPFSIVRDEGFRELLEGLEPSYQIPSRATFTTSLLVKKYDTVSQALMGHLQTADHVALTTDHWTSVANESYMAVTAHFITNKWEYHDCLLGCFPYDKSHTSENVCDSLKKVAQEWNITHKIVSVTTDNAPNVVNAVKLSGWSHIPCFAHTLNLIVQQGIHHISDLRLKAKHIVEYFHRSSQANAKLLNTQSQMEPGCIPLKLKNDVPTRWNSTFYMFERLLKIQEPLTATAALLHVPFELLSEEEWVTLKEICQVLQPFEQLTVEMSAEKTITLSKVILMVRGLKSFLNKIRTTINQPETIVLINDLNESIQRRFSACETNQLLAKATFLDPRFKNKAFIAMDAVKRVRERLQEEVAALITKNTDQQITQKNLDQPSTSAGTHSSPGPERYSEDLLWKEFDDLIASSTTIVTPTATAIVELRNYEQEPFLNRKLNPLLWWSNRSLILSNLSLLAKKYLCVVATSVPCERIFSKAGLVISDRRNRLKAKYVDKILFLNHNRSLC